MDLADRAGVCIADELAQCRREGFAGVNVTHPYKSAAFSAVDRTVSLPDGLTAINTVMFAEETSTGANTDCSGFVRAFRAEFGAGARDRGGY